MYYSKLSILVTNVTNHNIHASSNKARESLEMKQFCMLNNNLRYKAEETVYKCSLSIKLLSNTHMRCQLLLPIYPRVYIIK